MMFGMSPCIISHLIRTCCSANDGFAKLIPAFAGHSNITIQSYTSSKELWSINLMWFLYRLIVSIIVSVVMIFVTVPALHLRSERSSRIHINDCRGLVKSPFELSRTVRNQTVLSRDGIRKVSCNYQIL
jgi:hypothetical protein